MASERQIEANRRNAKRSTGPQTDAGRLASARNARRHGLSIPMERDEALVIAARGLAGALDVNETLEPNSSVALKAAMGHLEMRRVRQTRCVAILEILVQSIDCARKYDLTGFNRYERSAAVKRRRSIAQLLKL